MTARASIFKLNEQSLYLALVGIIGRPHRQAAFEVDEQGRLHPEYAGDCFVPLKGETVDAFCLRVVRECPTHPGDVVECTVFNGVLRSIMVQHRDYQENSVVLSPRRCAAARQALLLALAHGYGRLLFVVEGRRLRLLEQDLTLKLQAGESMDSLLRRMMEIGMWRPGDLIRLGADGKGRLSTAYIIRREGKHAAAAISLEHES